MQTLHKEQKIAISVGVTAILAAIGIVAALILQNWRFPYMETTCQK